LATEATSALSLESTTRRAHAPVPVHWQGIGNAEAQQAAQRVSAEARQVSTALAGASVAVASWAESVRHFNTEVDRINAQVTTAGTGTAAQGQTDQELAATRLAARQRGEREWHTAYDTYIVAGRNQAVHLVKKGPTDKELLALFQAGLLPMSVVNLYPNVDFSKTNWRLLFSNLRAQGIDPLSWATIGTYNPAELKARLDLMRAMGVPPNQYKNLLQMYWVSVAAQKAGIDLSQWDPNRGAAALKDIIKSVYTYYGNLFLQHPYMQWAGMANMVGPSFAAGFFDMAMFRRLAQALAGKPGVPADMSLLASASDQELKFFETTFLRMQKDIFFDQAMMHEAYLGGGMASIRELQEAGLIDPRTEQAWGQIDEGRRTGNNSLIKAGNTALLYREQHDVIQDNYQKMYDRPLTGPAFTYVMTAIGEPSIPGAKTFAEYNPLWVSIETPGPDRIPFTPWDNPLQGEVKIKTPLPDGNLAHFQDRWDYVSNDTLPAYQDLVANDPERAREIIASDVGDRIEDYRIYNRIDSLVWRFSHDWGVDFDQ
jgi:hypothetical protein